MKQRDKNKKHSEEFQDDENLTFGQDESIEETDLNDILSDDEKLIDDQEIDEEETLQEKYDELNNSHLRLHAEFDNYRKRTLKEKMEIIKAGGERVLTDMIPLIDDFERALEVVHQSDNKEAIVEGLELIYSKFISFLNQNGVKEIEAIGEPFNADKFEAITTIPVQDNSQKDIVVDCIQKGYILNEKVLRFPKVIVGK
ncbi:MAG: nucleotide exchange factor GrpE [Dysgonamonadaceae bacterium]|nr:nucleotide exchange factor GrpE [Dysgonamonadaceae bacterium]MDD4728458.1 nucleotide exchange factor GrpE [Dysgonamonadaceae bacterium]